MRNSLLTPSAHIRALLLLGAVLILATYLRLFIGIDVMDESGYIGIATTFAQGARPFFDEIATTQNVSILTMPFAKFFIWLVPSRDGLVLAFRHLYFLISLLTGFLIFKTTQKTAGPRLALILALLPICFVPFETSSLSYNTVGALGLLTSVFSFLGMLNADPSRTKLGFSALCAFAIGLATYGYPSMVIITLPLALYCLIRVYLNLVSRGERRRHLIVMGFAFSIWVGSALLTLKYAGVEGIQRTLRYYKILGVNFGGWKKFTEITSEFAAFSSVGMLSLASLAVVWLCGEKIPKRWWICVFLLPLLYLQYVPSFTGTLACFLVIYSGFIPIPFLIRKTRIPFLTEIRAFWVLSVAAAIVIAWTSSNGLKNSCLGLLTALILNFYTLAVLLQNGRFFKQATWAFEISLLTFMSTQVYCSYAMIYHDGPLTQLDARMTSGSYAGIFTISEKKAFLEELTHDLQSFPTSVKSVMFFDDFPAGYLLTDLLRHSQSIWTPSSGAWMTYDRSVVLEYFEQNPDQWPDIAVHILSFKGRGDTVVKAVAKPSDPVLHFFLQKPYRLEIAKPSYNIYRRGI